MAPATRDEVVEVFADISCPFTHVGLRRFVHRRCTAGRPGLRLHVRAWPLELVNGVALDADHVAETIEDLRGQVSRSLFLGFDRDRFPATTLPALDLVSDAYAVDLVTGERASLKVRDALFEAGEDVSDPSVLARLRGELALPGAASPSSRSRVLGDWEEGRRRGVIGSPHFFVGDEDWFCPNLTIERSDGGRRIVADPAALDELFARCLAA
jgi:predicted DsbA family dithiol-disulfide isomerase